MRYFYDTNDRYELANNGYANYFCDMDDGEIIEQFTDTLQNALFYLQNKYKIKLIEVKRK